MSYQVFSRKFRPQKFEEVIGQVHVSKTLKNAIKLGRVAHGYIFSGPRGVGKTTTARILAKAINCTEPIDFNPCGRCSSCISITEGRNIDILEIDGASNRGIDDIRDLRENAKYPPTSGKYRVYIIDEVHMLTKEAFNALLKTLEEPPPFVVFILATTDPHKIPATILSRTQKFDFKRISISDIINQLKLILTEENLDYDDDSLNLIAVKADGGLRDALSMLDQIIAFTESRIDLEMVMSLLGMVHHSVYQEITGNLLKSDIAKVLKVLDQTLSSGIAISDFINGFNDFVRNCMICIAGGVNSIRLDESTLSWINQHRSILNITDLMRILDLSLKYESGLKYLQHPRIGLETLLMKIASMDSAIELSDLVKKLSEPGKFLNIPAVQYKKKYNNLDEEPKHVKTKEISEPIPPQKIEESHHVELPELSIEIIQSQWKEVILHMEAVNARISTLFEESTVSDFDGETISVQIPAKDNGFNIKNIEKNRKIVEKVLRTIFHQSLSVRFYSNGSRSKDDVTSPQKMKGVQEHPLSLHLIEKFEGELIR